MSDVHARISAFEALASSPAPRPCTRPLSPDAAARFDPIAHSPSPSPPALGRKTSLIDLHDWVLDDGPRNSPPGLPSPPGLAPLRPASVRVTSLRPSSTSSPHPLHTPRRPSLPASRPTPLFAPSRPQHLYRP
ncbi:uncharacterized protein B0H18DRAFT_135246 [Fomitopsis serialis]|uniref:uncharacterized protein n=1 Tax=Fomitopsis serialis TaxID=139415 RepID=UPI0020084626|nr:uncharacterized protein B0H18DRAFT_135246 [Neoantrodia serialis]KAH9930773.1 hypothetical protein B0H18DRAFT_135246 [Neoantrodia serialis]